MTGLAFDNTGRHMATIGAEGQLKVWDMRMLRPLHSYLCRRPATTLDISQRGLLAVGFGRRIQVKGHFGPTMAGCWHYCLAHAP